MHKRIFVLTSLVFVLAAGALTVSAQWDNLGSKEVKDRSEQDTWNIGADKGQFRRIKIAVLYRPVRFYRLLVTFGNGTKQEVSVRSLIPAGGETRAIDLTGTDRNINKIEVWYEANTPRRGRRSMVTLYGMH